MLPRILRHNCFRSGLARLEGFVHQPYYSRPADLIKMIHRGHDRSAHLHINDVCLMHVGLAAVLMAKPNRFFRVVLRAPRGNDDADAIKRELLGQIDRLPPKAGGRKSCSRNKKP